jgi:hypothetical protein
MTNTASKQKQPNTKLQEAVEFLQELRPSGPWILTAISEKGPIRTETFTAIEEARKFISKLNADGANIYYAVNPTKHAISSKARKQDIAAVEFVHVDADPKDDETPDEFRDRFEPIVDEFDPPPTLIVDSGNGVQLLWRLRQPFKLAGDSAIGEIEARNNSLALSLGADPSTRNIDRIFRVPGTTNYPNEKKRRIGREECEARWVYAGDSAYDLEDFSHLDRERDDFPRSDRPYRNQHDFSGSGYGLHFFIDCMNRGLDFQAACNEILASTGKAGDWVRGFSNLQERERQMRRAYDEALTGRSQGKDSVHSWDDPDVSLLDDRRGDLPGFPIEALDPWLQVWVQRAARGAGTTIDHVAVPLLGIAGGLIGTARRIEATSSWSEPPFGSASWDLAEAGSLRA